MSLHGTMMNTLLDLTGSGAIMVALTWQCQHPPEVVTSLTILLVAVAGNSRLLGWTIILACLQLPAQVWGSVEKYWEDEYDETTPVGEDRAEEHFLGGTSSSVTAQEAKPVTDYDPISSTVQDCASQASVTVELWSAVGIIVILLTLYYRFELWRACLKGQHKYRHLSRADLSLSVQEEPVEIQQAAELQHPPECGTAANLRTRTAAGFSYGDLSASDLLSHVRSLQQEGGRGFSEEFLKLADRTQEENFPADHSNLGENECKNRYRNITAYDHSRVILRTGKSSLGQSDYINANYIQGYQEGQTYIATQGPLPRTEADFWLMVWENNSSVIVMLTNLVENGKVKCEQYWPSRGEAAYGELRVRLVWTDCRAFFTVRQLVVLGAGHRGTKHAAERTVYHYHYTQWPDHGVPDYSLPVLSFVQKSAAQSGPDNGPIIVHCSAGVGRTGTYIVIHSMLAQLRQKQRVNILGFIRDIRRQRNFLVQTESQLKLIHEVLVDYLVANGNAEVTEIQVLDYLLQPYKGMSPTSQPCSLEEQFTQITEYRPRQWELSAALEPINQSKNRIDSILPVNSSRVVLPDRPALASSDYINASFMQGYREAKEFIVTQCPMVETVEDFWWMVWHVQSPAIVLLSAGKDKESKRFWPKFGSSIKLDKTGLTVTSRDESVSRSPHCFRILELVVKFNKSERHLLTRIMVLKDGPICSMKLDTMFDSISAAQSYLTTRLECGPVTVVDRFGGVEAGTFCALWTLRDQLLCERSADFYQVCKLYHYKRPGIFASQEDYLLLHQAVAAQFKHLQDTPTPVPTC